MSRDAAPYHLTSRTLRWAYIHAAMYLHTPTTCASLSPLLHRHFHWHWHSLRHVVHSHLHLHLQSTLTTTCTSSLLPPPSPSFARATPVRLSATLACSAGLAPSFLLTPAMHIHLSAGVPQQGVPTFASASPPCTFHTSTYTSYLRPASRPLASALASLTLPRTYTYTPPPMSLELSPLTRVLT